MSIVVSLLNWAPVLLLSTAIGPEIGVGTLHVFKFGLQFFISFDGGVLDVPKYLGVTYAQIKLVK